MCRSFFFFKIHSQLAVNRDNESDATGDSGGVLSLGALVCSGRIDVTTSVREVDRFGENFLGVRHDATTKT